MRGSVPGAKAVAGWRALTRATGHRSLWQLFLFASGAIGSAIDSVCLGLGLASPVRAVDSSAQARDFHCEGSPGQGPPAWSFMQARHARFVAGTQFRGVDRPITKGEGIDLDWCPHLSFVRSQGSV